MFIVISQCVHIFRHTEYISKTLFRRTALGRSSRRTWGRSQRRISRRGSIPTYLSATGRGRRTSSRTARAERGREGGRESQYHSTHQHTAAHNSLSPLLLTCESGLREERERESVSHHTAPRRVSSPLTCESGSSRFAMASIWREKMSIRWRPAPSRRSTWTPLVKRCCLIGCLEVVLERVYNGFVLEVVLWV